MVRSENKPKWSRQPRASYAVLRSSLSWLSSSSRSRSTSFAVGDSGSFTTSGISSRTGRPVTSTMSLADTLRILRCSRSCPTACSGTSSDSARTCPTRWLSSHCTSARPHCCVPSWCAPMCSRGLRPRRRALMPCSLSGTRTSSGRSRSATRARSSLVLRHCSSPITTEVSSVVTRSPSPRLSLSLACSNVGVAMAASVAVAVLLRRGWQAAAVPAIALAAIYVAWWAKWGHLTYQSTRENAVTALPLAGRLLRSTVIAFTQSRSAAVLLVAIFAIGVALAGRVGVASDACTRFAAPSVFSSAHAYSRFRRRSSGPTS